MKIDRSKLKKSTSEVPFDCQALIERLKTSPDLLAELQGIKSWNYGKCELYHWVDVLDRFDGILEEGCAASPDQLWRLSCDHPQNVRLKESVHSVLTFTALLIEHSFSRHLYSSVEHLTTLLASSDMNTVLAVLNLVYVFSKRSNFLIKLAAEKRQELFSRLTYLAESWGGKENGFGLAECCKNAAKQGIPPSATTLHFEFYSENTSEEKVSVKKHAVQAVTVLHLENVDRLSHDPVDVMEDLLSQHSVPKDKQMLLFTHIRLAHCFSNHQKRLQCVQARLQALSVLVYSSAIQEISSSLLYSGLIEELVDVLQLEDAKLVDIKSASLRTLTSIIHLDRNPELVTIIDATGAASYHGFLPVMVRQCIQAMINPDMESFPHSLATSLFSFLYHLASYETGGEALVSCGMMESLLKVIKWPGEDEQLHTTFVTRAVRVVDLITNLDMAAFQTHGGLSTFINRLEHEISICRRDVPFVIKPTIRTSQDNVHSAPPSPFSEDSTAMETDSPSDGQRVNEGASSSSGAGKDEGARPKKSRPASQCFPQRAALLKSMLNFLKKAIQDPSFSDSIRHVMDGSLPSSLKHIISNAEYYSASLFLLACELVTVYVFQEPSLLSSLQDTGLTDVMLHALLIKDVPATKEVLGSLPNIFSALCLNSRGLDAFNQCKPFEKLFKVLLSPVYLPAMRRRRTNDAIGDTASSLGSAMDELMRHQPSLKDHAMMAIIKLMEDICTMGHDPNIVCSRSAVKSKTPASSQSQATNGDDTSSDDEDEEDEVPTSVREQEAKLVTPIQPQSSDPSDKIPVPLMDYILNVMKFVEAILCNNATDDHCWEFVSHRGLEPLLKFLRLPNLPIDFPTSSACQSVASVCKAILSLARESGVLTEGLLMLKEELTALKPLQLPLEPPGGSILLRELVNSPNFTNAPLGAPSTPLLRAMVSAHSYVTMLVHVCRVGQTDVRTISVKQWGSELGQEVLRQLSHLYISLVWESIVLLALFTPGTLPEGCQLGKLEREKLLPKDFPKDADAASTSAAGSSKGDASARTSELDPGAGSGSTLMDVSDALSTMEVDDTKGDAKDLRARPKPNAQMLQTVKQAMPVLYAPSRLGKALSELFGLLVKLCVGSSVRQRSRQHLHPNLTPPSEAARNTAKVLMELLLQSLSWTPPPASPLPKFRVTFYICAVSFASPMLFDDKKNPYHLMLQKFVSTGAHTALFDAFHWAVTMGGKMRASECMEHPDLPEGTGEFIDAWLSLIEKLVNPEAVLDSPHSMPMKASVPGYTPFNPVQFLINTHKAAFSVIMNLWGCRSLKSLGSRTAESLLAILCHILRGESVIAERVKQAKSDEAGGSSTAAGEGTSSGGAGTSSSGSSSFGRATRGLFESGFLTGLSRNSWPRTEPNEEHVTQLMDMGFPREHAVEALQHSTSLERAAEWALTHPPRLPQSFGGTGLSEEEEMMQAIAMSLGEAIQPPVDQQEEERKKKEEEERKKKEEEERKLKQMEEQDKIPEEAPLDKAILNDFVDSMLPGCLKLLDDIPETVYRVCDLLVVANNRNGEEWRDKMLEMVISQISENAVMLCNNFASMLVDPSAVTDTKVIDSLSCCLASRIHLLCLLFEEIRMACAQRVEVSNILHTLIELLDTAQRWMAKMKQTKTPKWMGPAMLLIDLSEKTVLTCKRKLAQKGASHTWKWFDDSTGRWCTYSRSNNKTIDDAYWAGKPSVRFTAARRRYIVHFNTMIQVNEETMNKRPIMQALPTPKAEEDKGEKKEDDGEREAKKLKTSESLGAVPKTDVAGTSQESKDDSVAKEPEIVEIQGLGDKEIPTLIRACVGLIGVPVDPDTMHAVLRICLRFTRDHKTALLFAELGGPRLLLSLTQASSFNSFPILANLLLRHVFEEKAVLQNTMDKLICAVASKGVGCNTCNVTLGSVGCREMNFVLRKLGPLACRNQELFINSAKNNLKIALLPAKRGEEDESRYTGPNALQLLTASAPKTFSPPALKGPMLQVLCELLDALVAPVEATHSDEAKAKVPESQPTPAAAAAATQVPPGTSEGAMASELQTSEDIGMGLREIGDRLLGIYSGSRGPPRTADRLNSVPDGAVQEDDATDQASSSSGVSSSQGSSSAKKSSPAAGAGSATAASTKDETSKNKLLIPKSAILRLLAELVMSYAGIAQAVAQYHYSAGQTKHIKEDGPALAYILDQLLPQCQKGGDKDCPGLAQVLLASIAASNHSPDAQMFLVTEIKSALGRTLAMPESSEKHSRIQALTMLISIMIEACTFSTSAYQSAVVSSSYKNQLGGMNNITRLLLRKGLVTDLARVPHSLDLSSPNMASTVNSALKPLETLSRIVNHPHVRLRGLSNIRNVTQYINQRSASGADSAGGAVLRRNMDASPSQHTAQGGGGRTSTERESSASALGLTGDTQDSTDLDEPSDLDCIVDELLDRTSGGAGVLGETLIATGPERLGSLRSAFVDQAGEASQDEMVITMTDDGEEMEQSLGDAEMRSQHSHEGVRTDIDADDDSVQDEDSAAESDSDDGNEDRQDEGEEDEEDEEEEDEEEEEEDEEDHDDGSEMDAEDYDITEDLDYFRVGDRDEDMWMGETDEDMLIQLDPVFSGVPASIRTYQLPVAIHDDARNANDVSAPNIPVPPSVISASHPLLVRHGDHTNLTHGVSQSNRNQRASRQRVNRGTTQTVHIYHSGSSRPPNVQNVLRQYTSSLPRLLGLSSSTDIVQLTTSSTSQGNQTRVYVANSGDDINQNHREEVSDIFEEGYSLGYFSASNFLSVVPPVYRRWDEESKVLDGRSMHDCVQALKPEIIEVLEKHRDEELAERKEKRKKQAEEEAKKKAEEEAKKAEEETKKTKDSAMKTPEESKEKEENMEVGESSEQAQEAEGAENLSTTESSQASSSGRDMGQLVASVAESALGTAISSALSAATLSSTASTAAATTTSSTTTTVAAMPSATPAGSQQAEALSSYASGAVSSSSPAAPAELSRMPQLVTVTASTSAPTSTVSASGSSVLPQSMRATPQSDAFPSVTATLTTNTASVATATTRLTTIATTMSTTTTPTVATTALATAASAAATTTTSFTSPASVPQPSQQTSSSIFASLDESDPMAAPITTMAAPQGTSSPVVSMSSERPASSSGRPDSAVTGISCPSSSAVSGLQLPEGVDPSFLAALPENIRQEVLQEHLGIRNQPPPSAPSSNPPSSQADPSTSSLSQVNPEFLAALPPHIQEEVLAQERAEQQRRTLAAATAASTPSASVVPAEPVDPAAFIQNLPPGLRQTVLADMDDSVLAVLPADIAAEAQALRLDRVLRHRQLMQERLLRETGMLSAILRYSGLQGRLGHGMNYYRLSVPRQTGQSWGWGNSGSNRSGGSQSRQGVSSAAPQNQGRQLVDLEALTCLLVLLFVNEPKLNLVRLLRVLRNLSFHQPTRQWILQALLSIMERTKSCRAQADGKHSIAEGDPLASVQRMDSMSGKAYQQPSWLSISMDAALGCRASVFKVQRSSKKSSDKQGSLVCIHPQVAPMVCRHVLDALLALAKEFPYQFIPVSSKKDSKKNPPGNLLNLTSGSSTGSSSDRKAATGASQETADDGKTVAGQSDAKAGSKLELDFWDLLVRLDNTSQGRKGKVTSRVSTVPAAKEGQDPDTSNSALSKLMAMLSHPVVKRSTALTDKLLHLLSMVTSSLPDGEKDKGSSQQSRTGPGTAIAAIRQANQSISSAMRASSNRSSALAVAAPSCGDQSNNRSQSGGEPSESPNSAPVGSPMDTASQELPDTQSVPEEESTSKAEPAAPEKTLIDENLLQLAVEVLTAHTCSEDGLEDATTMLMQLSRGHGSTREAVLRLLLQGAQELGQTLCRDIVKLLGQVQEYRSRQQQADTSSDDSDDSPVTEASTSGQMPKQGAVADRYNPAANIVITAPATGTKRSGFELRLQSMGLFTGKTSNQNFLLRMLKVIIQLREVAKKAKRVADIQRLGGPNIAAAVAALETNASELMQMMSRRSTVSASSRQTDRQNSQTSQGASGAESSSATTTPSGTANTTPVSEQLPSTVPTGAAQPPGVADTTPSGGALSGPTETPMEVDQSVQPPEGTLSPQLERQASTSGQASQKQEEEEDGPRLSDLLGLEDLWETLSTCLTELSLTPDPHAVLVLQPAVEAFFLVHASDKDATKAGAESSSHPAAASAASSSSSSSSHPAREGLTTSASDTGPISPVPSTPASGIIPPGFFTRESSVTSIVTPNMPNDTQKFLRFAEKHRNVLNQILRQSTVHLSEGPFSVLVNHVRILDFDVKRRYFRQELERADEGVRREDMAIHVRREHVFEDSYRELHRRTPEQWKNRFYVVFEGEEGQDAGGLLREWYLIISKEIFNPMYALFRTSPGDRVTYIPNPSSHCNSNHLSYFKFVGRIIAKAIYDNKLLECYFSRSFYKHILGKSVKYTDMESEDYAFYQGLVFLLEHDVSDLGYDLSFSTEIEEFGVTEARDLKFNGSNIMVTEENKHEYVHLVCQMKMTGAIRKQIDSFLEGFYDIIPKKLIGIFNEQEMELLIAGLPTIDVDDLKANTEYHKYQSNSLQIQWFWRALRSFDQATRAKFVQFVTGTSKVPLQGFSSLEGMNGPQKFQIHRDDRSTDRLPTAHTCFNQLDLPAYETYDKLRRMLLLAIEECTEGFGLA
ncbi:E3 ubiquitin-protein ligase HUWE1-like [Diadema antillarum]|uniref:E3 ubiquitin-protein ligase HUWE1-like n=1 Tax=Diadema antillarum TaxID=105358 RepID=UPI003A848F02